VVDVNISLTMVTAAEIFMQSDAAIQFGCETCVHASKIKSCALRTIQKERKT
jgi:hypothetical protein